MEIFQDDCLLKTKSVPEMFDLMILVFKRFREAKLKLNLDKCSFMIDVVPFLGMTISKHGTTPQAPKLEEISTTNQYQSHATLSRDVQCVSSLCTQNGRIFSTIVNAD